MARVEPRVDDDRASLADAAASRCRARADVVRDALASAHREFTARGTLDEPLVSAALDAFDGRIARAVAHDAPALGGFVDATEAQLLKRNHGAALSNLLAFARATAVARSRLAVDVASSPHGARVHETTGEGGEGGPGAALELMLLFPRAERTRAALLAHYSDELTRCLDGIDVASREGTRLAGDDPRTAVAVGAVFWLSRRLDVRGTDAKPHAPSFDEIERVFLEERSAALKANMEELDALFQRRDAAELKYMEDVAATADAYRKELEKHEADDAEEYTMLKIRLETDIANLQRHLADMKSTYLLNAEKLEYNYRVLVERDHENAGTLQSVHAQASTWGAIRH